MEKIAKNKKERQKNINSKKNFNIMNNSKITMGGKKANKGKDNRGAHKRDGGHTASRAVANSATITCTMVKDPNIEDPAIVVFNRFAVLTYPAKGLDNEMLGPFDSLHSCVHAGLEYLKPLFDETTENLYVRTPDGGSKRYGVIGGIIQHG